MSSLIPIALFPFTMFDAVENSNDHWVFICEEGIPNNEYNEEPRLMQRSALAFFSVL